MQVPLLDLAAQNRTLAPRLLGRIRAVVESGCFILGPEVARFERESAAFLCSKYAVGCSSGSDALVLALRALDIGEGDEVITTPFSFFATVESIVRVGARPRFADVCQDTLTLDADAVPAAFTPQTRAILGVHLYGCPGRADRWRTLAGARGVALIEDAAQAFGANVSGRAAGTFGALGCFSFQPTKPLGATGDAGLIVTDDQLLAERCVRLRSHGATSKHNHQEIGGNYRLDALQAAVLSEKLGELPRWLAARHERARAYDDGLSGLPSLALPARPTECESSHALYTVRVGAGRRDDLARFLRERGIETAVHYPVPLHRQPALLALGIGQELGTLPNAERAAEEVLTLPLYPELEFAQLGYVVASIREFFGC